MSTTILRGAEIFSTGTHNGLKFSESDIDSIVKSFDALNLSGHIPLKLSHSGDDARDKPESKFALGWCKKVWREGSKLLADLEIPQKVADAIKAGYLRFVSVELLKGVKAGTRTIPWTLDAIALLGSEQPAVGDLLGLQTLMTRAPFQFESRTVFTRTHGDLHGMTELEQKLTKQLIDQMFASNIENGRLLPRDQYAFSKRYPEGSATVEDAQRWIADSPKPSKQFGRVQGAQRVGGNDPESSGDPGEQLVVMARELAAERGVDLGAASPQEFDKFMMAAMQRNRSVSERYKAQILTGED